MLRATDVPNLGIRNHLALCCLSHIRCGGEHPHGHALRSREWIRVRHRRRDAKAQMQHEQRGNGRTLIFRSFEGQFWKTCLSVALPGRSLRTSTVVVVVVVVVFVVVVIVVVVVVVVVVAV